MSGGFTRLAEQDKSDSAVHPFDPDLVTDSPSVSQAEAPLNQRFEHGLHSLNRLGSEVAGVNVERTLERNMPNLWSRKGDPEGALQY